MTEQEDDAFVDLQFRLVHLRTGADGSHHLEARGRHRGQELGFAASIESVWRSQPIDDTDDFFYWGAVVLRSVGAETDRLLVVLDALYGTSLAPRAMRRETRCTAVGLAADPRTAHKSRVPMKLFFEDEDPDRYGELYFNVDLVNRRVELHEKDPEYRRAVVLALRDDAA